jgi:hypothetical protein
MLRCINAREAALVDAAAGLHVRFRLGGSSFPPLVFYKIFTHRPVTGTHSSSTAAGVQQVVSAGGFNENTSCCYACMECQGRTDLWHR